MKTRVVESIRRLGERGRSITYSWLTIWACWTARITISWVARWLKWSGCWRRSFRSWELTA